MDIILTVSLKNGLNKNGLTQNILFFSELLSSIGFNVILCVNHSSLESKHDLGSLDVIEKKDLAFKKDCGAIIQIGWAVEDAILLSLSKNNSSCKVIDLHYGNQMVSDMELYKTNNNCKRRNKHVDEIWISPHFSYSKSYLQTLYKTPKVLIAPYLWSPKYVDKEIDIAMDSGVNLFYEPGGEKNFAILEPNLSLVKNCITPMVILENVWQKDRSIIDKVNVYCSHNIIDKQYFLMLMNQLDLVRENKTIFHGRSTLSNVFKYNSACISHQFLCSLNYIYLECMYLGVPIVHNSELIKDAGFYYHENDVEAGSNVTMNMVNTYDKNMKKHKTENQKIIDKYSINSEENKNTYKLMLT